MRILLSNDDGIHARGLKSLEKIARDLSDDVWVVAPQEEQSGAARSLTLHNPIRVRKYEDKRFSVSGDAHRCCDDGSDAADGRRQARPCSLRRQ